MSSLLNKHESMLKDYRLEGESDDDNDEQFKRPNKAHKAPLGTTAQPSSGKSAQPSSNRTDDYQDRDDDDDDDYDDVVPSAARKSSTAPEGEERANRKVNDCKIFVGNLPFTAVKLDLENLFSQFGLIIGVNVRTDRLTNKPKGFAFVTFDNSDSADKAVQQMNGFSLQGRPLTVSMADVRGSNKKGEEGDAAWKTVATASKKDKEKLAKQGKTTKATWDHWTGPQGPAVKKESGSKGSKDAKKK